MKRTQLRSEISKFFMPIVILIPLVLVGVGISFLIWPGFSAREFSDRVSFCGIGAAVLAALGVFAALGSYRSLGTPSILTAPGDARVAHERVAEQMMANAKRYGFIFQMLLVMAVCLGIGALIDLVFV
ncbi:MAG: hypothetical protein JW934_18450 [Anaerolineae bacterium]|nr:hypothetical protein [Anaerolineae bacterium]